jgi:hypothetical protein
VCERVRLEWESGEWERVDSKEERKRGKDDERVGKER